MALYQFLIIALSLCYLTYARDLPDYVVKCKRNDPDLNNCVKDSGNAAIPKIVLGVKEFKIPRLDPMEGLKVKIESPKLKLTAEDVSVAGLGKAKITNADVQFSSEKEGHIKLKLHAPKFSINGRYTVSGAILVPISGEGDFTLEGEDVSFDCVIKCTFYDKSGKQHMDCKAQTVDFVVKDGKIEMGNLFGNEDLSRETNKALNQNFQVVIKEFAPGISETIIAIADELLKHLCDEVPLDSFFLL